MTTNQQASEFSRELGRRVRNLRGDVLLTRRDLAERSGVSERYLASLETGQANPSLAILFRLAGALDLRIEQLLCPQKSDLQTRAAATRVSAQRQTVNS